MVLNDLYKHIDDYCKDQQYLKSKNMYSLLKDKLPDAIVNCLKLENYNKQNSVFETKGDVYKNIQAINKIAGKE